MHTEFQIETAGQGLYESTRDIQSWAGSCGVRQGLLKFFVRHPSCSLL